MNRTIVYPGAQILDTDMLAANRDSMTAIGMALKAVLGTQVIADGLACTPTAPASLSVLVGQGSLTTYAAIDPSDYGSFPADATQIVKQGINLGTATFTVTAPATAGQSQNYLIEGAFLEQDGTPVVLPYFNSTDPTQPYSGPNNSGTSNYTRRLETVQLQIKAGAAAPTGTQATPAVDAGWYGLWVVTVAQGQTTVTAGNITQYASAPFMPYRLPDWGSRLAYLLGQAGITPNPGTGGAAELYQAIASLITSSTNGGPRFLNKTTNYTALPADDGAVINFTTAGHTLSVTAAATLGNGWSARVRNAAAAGSGYITINPTAAEMVDGGTTCPLAPGDDLGFYCDGTAFYTTGRKRVLISELTITGGSAEIDMSLPDDLIRYFNELQVVWHDIYLTAADYLLLEMGSGTDAAPVWLTTGYLGETNQAFASGGSGDDNLPVNWAGHGPNVAVAITGANRNTGRARLTRMDTTIWVTSGQSAHTDNHYTFCGYNTLSGFNRVRLRPSATATLSGGVVRLYGQP